MRLAGILLHAIGHMGAEHDVLPQEGLCNIDVGARFTTKISELRTR